MSGSPRDFVGYGSRPPHPHWPGGARVALNLVINYEEGAELSPGDGDPVREPFGEATYPIPIEERDFANEAVYEYGSRVGIWRVLDAFRERSMAATAFVSARAFERNPEVARTMADDGIDVLGHGYRWEIHWGKDPAVEREEIERCLTAIERLTGTRPEGWFTRYASSPATREILVEKGIFYDSTSYADDLPYWANVGTGHLLIVPYTIECNDVRFWRGSFATATQFFEYLRDALDVLLAEGQHRPRMMSVGLHPRIVGRPGRFAGLQRFLDYAGSRTGVWVARRGEIAHHWADLFPYQDRGS
jgi:allantoinase